jgi:hypothetical protein
MSTQEVVQAYMEAWNETDEGKRRVLLDKAWADNGTYTDPMQHAEGRDELIGLISQFQQQMPGASIVMASLIDEHHDRLRFQWRMEGGPQAMEGIDIGKTAADGRLESIVGFFGAAPPPAS